jgi:nitrate reductase gamma subunit
MTIVLFAVLYLSLAVFVIACIARAVYYARQPMHLRWELYPVPHEPPDKVKHGGSYFEDLDWWKNGTNHKNMAGELTFMIPEMLFLKGLWEFNRKMWIRSFPFHFGLYMLMGTIGLVFVSALLGIFAPALMAGGLGLALHWIYTVTAFCGFVLAIAGAAALLLRRLTDPQLKIYTVPGDVFNLLFFIVALALLLAGYLLRGPQAPGTLEVAMAVLTFDTSVKIPALLAMGMILSALLVAYIPLTHMSHFIGKYFTYHSIRWNDEVNLRGSRIEKKLAECLMYKPTWSASHVKADGTRTWADVATTNPTQEGGQK